MPESVVHEEEVIVQRLYIEFARSDAVTMYGTLNHFILLEHITKETAQDFSGPSPSDKKKTSPVILLSHFLLE